MIFISAEDTEQVFSWPNAVDAIVRAYSADLDPRGAPGRIIAVHGEQSMRCMPAISPVGRYMGAKHLVKTPRGYRYAIVLFDKDDSELAMIVDGLSVTAFRTAATSAAALRLLTPDEPVDLAILGSSGEARQHLAAIASVRRVTRTRVFSPSPQSRCRFVEWAAAELSLDVTATDSGQAAVTGASCVVAAARSRGEQPIVFGPWLTAARTVISVGSTLPSQRELDTSVLRDAALIVSDEPHELLSGTGDLSAAATAGLDVTDKLFSLRALVRHEIEPKHFPEDSFALFKSVGSGLQDIAVAEALADSCLRAGLGMRLPVSLALK